MDVKGLFASVEIIEQGKGSSTVHIRCTNTVAEVLGTFDTVFSIREKID